MRRTASEIIKGLEMRVARLERTSATRKVAGHIIIAGNVNVRQLRRDLEDTFGIEDIEIEDGVLTFLMSNLDNKKVEKQVKALAQKHDVKFEKGEFTDGLGMIYTKNASQEIVEGSPKHLDALKRGIKDVKSQIKRQDQIIKDLSDIASPLGAKAVEIYVRKEKAHLEGRKQLLKELEAELSGTKQASRRNRRARFKR